MMRNEKQHKVQLLKKGLKKGRMSFKFVGTSMSPLIKPGFRITIKSTQDIKEGDLLVYAEKGGLICHRLILIKGDKFYLKGDARTTPDRTLQRKDILGKVVEVKDTKGRRIPISRLGQRSCC